MQRDRGIYVEIYIDGNVDEVWSRTQTPDLHGLLDLRFSSIAYLPRNSDDEPQRFLYSTRLGFGLKIDGEGESTGTRADAAGVRTSALKFWSGDLKSLIEEGSGYWQYVPSVSGTRFLTWYDYRTRFGSAGRAIDGLVFRPLIGWATAWSFDRLRLWIETGLPPRTAMRMFLIHATARIGISFIWLWHGLVPKLLFANADERMMLEAAGMPGVLLPVIGLLEVAIAIAALAFWRWRAFFQWNALAMVAALAAVVVRSPSFITAAFNPVTLNMGVALLSVIGYIAAAETPFASRCLRKPSRAAA